MALASDSNQFIGSVPKEIHQLMKKKGCFPIKGFYDRELIVSPPFVYASHLFDDGGSAIIFACEIDKPKTDARYKIVLIKWGLGNKGNHYSDFEGCPNEIHFRRMPGGLSVWMDPSPSLISSMGYNRWGATVQHVWDGNNLSSTNIKDVPWILNEQAEGVGVGLFCVQGEWYHVSYH